jgi:hypothetical protein
MLRDTSMTGKNTTPMDLADAVYQKVGLSRMESADLVGQVLGGISASLTEAESVKFRLQRLHCTQQGKTGDPQPGDRGSGAH